MTDHDQAPSGWTPMSPCGEDCLPAENRGAVWRPWCRGIALVAVLITVAGTAPLLMVLTSRPRAGWLQMVCRSVLAAMGIRVRIHGPRTFGDAGVLVVANHLSWIEVLALSAVQPVRLIAKREVRQWFLVGAVAAATGSLFIDRGGLRNLPATIADVTAALRAGHAIAVFPEGTTWCGAAAGPFRRAAFQAALDALVPVRPVAVTLRRAGRVTREAAFVGEQDLLTSIVRVLRLSALVCELTVLPTIAPRGDRAQLAHLAGSAITATTGIGHTSHRAHPTRGARPAVHGRPGLGGAPWEQAAGGAPLHRSARWSGTSQRPPRLCRPCPARGPR